MQIHFNTHQALWFAVVSTGVWISNGIRFQDQSCKVMLILPNLSNLPLWQEVTFFEAKIHYLFSVYLNSHYSSDIFALIMRLTVMINPWLWSPITCFFENICMYIRGFTKFGIKVLWRLQFLIGYRTLSLKFQKARTKIEVVLSLPSWLSQLNWDS